MLVIITVFHIKFHVFRNAGSVNGNAFKFTTVYSVFKLTTMLLRLDTVYSWIYKQWHLTVAFHIIINLRPNYLPKKFLSTTRVAIYAAKEISSPTTIIQCQVRIVNATISNSVSIRDVNVIDITWTKSWSKSRKAPYIITAPEWKNKSIRICCCIVHHNNENSMS